MRGFHSKVHPRRIARVYSFQFLYHLQFRGIKESVENLEGKNILQSIENFNEMMSAMETDSSKMLAKPEIPIGKNMEYALSLITGVLSKYGELEKTIETHSKNWTIAKLAKVDLTILLQSTYELMYLRDTPQRVVMDEAIEIAKSFSDEQSCGFINGVLDAIAKSLSKSNDNQSTDKHSTDKQSEEDQDADRSC
ncbi:MAG: transcription antitermination factor NusB [Oligoflexia bacterium]|nr:transcription antitermination factor NusB [Oligoflexia bacterium]